MKSIHTPLGRIRSNKKLILGALALTMIGGSMSALVNNSSALDTKLGSGYEPIYTTVGPDYFTLAELDYYLDDGVTMRVTDTSVADFYTFNDEPIIIHDEGLNRITEEPTVKLSSDAPVRLTKMEMGDEYEPIYSYDRCNEEYSCLQGKKIGETEIVIERYNEEIARIPLISVELTPKAFAYDALNKTFEDTGSINGADNSLLRLRNTYLRFYGASGDEDAIARITGPRSFSVDTTDVDGYNLEVHLVWTIGNQRVGGGTYYDLYNIQAEDQISHSSENEDILIKSFFNTWDGDCTDGDRNGFYCYGLDGTVVHEFNFEWPRYANRISDNIILSKDDSELSNSNQEKLTNKLPKDVDDIKYEKISAKLYSVFREEHAAAYSSSAISVPQKAAADDGDLVFESGEFIKLGTPIKISLDASDAPELKAGYTRTYYAAVLNDGEIKTVEGTYDAKAKTVTFETTVFGDYAYGYIDEFVPTVPNTGSIEKVAVVATATFAPLAVLTLGAFIARNKKKASNKLAKKHNHFE